jgi:hypothetical protein
VRWQGFSPQLDALEYVGAEQGDALLSRAVYPIHQDTYHDHLANQTADPRHTTPAYASEDDHTETEGTMNMSQELKIGDRVRITTERPVHGYQPGSRGTAQSGPTTDKGGKILFVVGMDKDDANDGTIFLADEIEADA